MKYVYNLFRVQLLNGFGINSLIHTKDKKEKRKGILITAIMIYALVVMWPTTVFYFYSMMTVYNALGVPEALLAVAMVMCSLLCLVTTIYKGSPTLFGFSDFDIIMPMPIKTSYVVMSKLIMLYFLNIGFSLFVMIPAAGVYIYFVSPGPIFYISIILLTLVLPLLPIIIATALSVGINIVSSRFRSKNIVNIILSLIFFVGIMAISFSSANITEEFVTDISVYLMNTINRMYPPASLFVDAAMGNILAFFAFFLLSVAAFALFSVGVSKVFRSLRTHLTTTTARSNFDIKLGGESKTMARSALNTLYRKEVRRYFASPIYVINTIIGAIMLFLLTIVLFFGGNSMFEQLLEIPDITQKIGVILPLVISATLGMTNPAAISISMEGRSFALLKSLPVSAMTVFSAKILFNLTLTIPALIINAPLLAFFFKLDLFQSVMCFVIPLFFCIMSPLLGIYINLMFPNFKWTSEVSVVKQSVASMLGMLIPMFVGIAGAVGLAFVSPAYANLALAGVALLFALVSIIIFSYLKKNGETIYIRLI